MSTDPFDRLVEKQELESNSFKQALQAAFIDAELLWAPERRGQSIFYGMATIAGSVSQESPFQMQIDENEYLVLTGLRTHYNADDTCKFMMIADGMESGVYIVDSLTRYLMFMNKTIWRPLKDFRIEAQQGKGILRFVCIGSTIYHHHFKGWDTSAYSVIQSDNMLNETVQRVNEANIRARQMIDGLEEPK